MFEFLQTAVEAAGIEPLQNPAASTGARPDPGIDSERAGSTLAAILGRAGAGGRTEKSSSGEESVENRMQNDSDRFLH